MRIFFCFLWAYSSLSFCAGMTVGSMSLASDEIVYELLKRAGRLENLVAVSVTAKDKKYSHISKEVQFMKRFVGSSPEALWALHADVWIGASYNRKALLDVVQRKKSKLVLLENFSRLDDVRKHIFIIGDVLNLAAHARALNLEFDTVVQQPSKNKKKLKVALWSSNGVVAGKDTIWNDLVQHAGGKNVVLHQGWEKISPERLALLKPDLIITTSDPQLIKKSQGWNMMSAVSMNKIVQVDGRSLGAVSHHVLKALKKLRQVFQEFS